MNIKEKYDNIQGLLKNIKSKKILLSLTSLICGIFLLYVSLIKLRLLWKDIISDISISNEYDNILNLLNENNSYVTFAYNILTKSAETIITARTNNLQIAFLNELNNSALFISNAVVEKCMLSSNNNIFGVIINVAQTITSRNSQLICIQSVSSSLINTEIIVRVNEARINIIKITTILTTIKNFVLIGSTLIINSISYIIYIYCIKK